MKYGNSGRNNKIIVAGEDSILSKLFFFQPIFYGNVPCDAPFNFRFFVHHKDPAQSFHRLYKSLFLRRTETAEPLRRIRILEIAIGSYLTKQNSRCCKH
jgi:hypothetical protein